jgi:predicted permease
MRATSVIDWIGRDLRYASRGISRRPLFALAIVVTLALGIGANTAIFSVVRSVLIKPLPYPDSDALVSLWHTAPGANIADLNFSPTMYSTYRRENRSFESIGMWTSSGATLRGAGEPDQVRTVWATHGTLQALAVQPLLGRLLLESEDVAGADGPQPVILTYSYWQRRFGGDESAVGRAVTINAQPAEIVGVMPRDFRFLDVTDADAILALRSFPGQMTIGTFTARGIARLRPGVSLEQANTDVARMLPIWLDAWPIQSGGLTRESIESWRIAPSLRQLKTDIVGSVTSMLWVLMATIGAVLLVACANVANLLLVHAETRRHDFAIRAALGAGPGRIARELLVESGVLGAAGGAAGLAIAYLGIELLVAMGPATLPRLHEIAIDPVALAFAVSAGFVSSLAFGSVPALRYGFRRVSLNVGARGASAGRERSSTRSALVVVQVALAFSLTVSSALMIRTFEALRDVDAGFTNPDTVQTARITVGGPGMSSAQALQMQRDILNKVAALPGVDSASYAYAVPMEPGRISVGAAFAEDRAYAASDTQPQRRQMFVAPNYFATMGTRLIAGRDVTWTDIDNGGYVAVISESMAREIWGGPAAALGKRIRDNATIGSWREVIAVAQDVHADALHLAPPSMVYYPIKMEGFSGGQTFLMPAINYVVRSDRAGTESLVREIQQAVWSINADLPVFLIRTVQDLYADSLARMSFTLVLLGIAGAMALGLGVIGIYGVISYIVSQRTREIGIRLALGAPVGTIKRMFVRQGLKLTAVGVGIGLIAAVALTRLMTALLFGVGPLDPVSYGLAFAVIAGAAALASYMPARRAATVNPIETLRAE